MAGRASGGDSAADVRGTRVASTHHRRLLAIGFVPAVIFSWVFELTLEGLKRDEDVAPEQSIAPQTGRRMDRMIIVVLVLALGYLAFRPRSPRPLPTSCKRNRPNRRRMNPRNLFTELKRRNRYSRSH